MPVLKARISGAWVDLGGADEVYIGETDPGVGYDLWYQTPSTTPPVLPLARVQATPKTSVTAVSATATFSAIPSVGNAIIVFVNTFDAPSLPTTAVTDNRGNTYQQAITRANSVKTAIYFCPKITTTGGPFTVTVTPGASAYRLVVMAVEVQGVGTAGLSVDKTASVATNFNSTLTCGPTAALTANDVFLAACFASQQAGFASIVVNTTTPPWTEELEDTGSAQVNGEADTRVLSSAAGTTQSVVWTMNTSYTEAGVLVAFKPTNVALYTAASTGLKVRVDGAWVDVVAQLTDGQRLLGRETGPGPTEEITLGDYITITDGVLDVAGAGETPFIVQSIPSGRSSAYLPNAQQTALLASGIVTVQTGTGVLGSIPKVPSANLDISWVTPTFDAGNFYTDTGTWTVAQSHVLDYSYLMLGPNAMLFSAVINSAPVTGNPNELRIKIPNNRTTKHQHQISGIRIFCDGKERMGIAYTSAGLGYIGIFSIDMVQERIRTYPTGSCVVAFQITLDLN